MNKTALPDAAVPGEGETRSAATGMALQATASRESPEKRRSRISVPQRAHGYAWQAAEPLWQRAPARGEDGRPFSDFMMLIPGLRRGPQGEFLSIADRIQKTLDHYRHAVVFADLNPRLNVLWVTVRPIPGICLDVATAINAAVPQARLVAHYPQG